MLWDQSPVLVSPGSPGGDVSDPYLLGQAALTSFTQKGPYLPGTIPHILLGTPQTHDCVRPSFVSLRLWYEKNLHSLACTKGNEQHKHADVGEPGAQDTERAGDREGWERTRRGQGTEVTWWEVGSQCQLLLPVGPLPRCSSLLHALIQGKCELHFLFPEPNCKT